MVDFYLEWGGDLVLAPDGGVQLAIGWDQVRERIIRHVLTNSAVPLPDGSTTPPDYVFAPSYGLSAGALVDQNPTQAYVSDLTRRIRHACLSDVAVDPGKVPDVRVTKPQLNTIQVFVSVALKTGQTGSLSIAIGSST